MSISDATTMSSASNSSGKMSLPFSLEIYVQWVSVPTVQAALVTMPGVLFKILDYHSFLIEPLTQSGDRRSYVRLNDSDSYVEFGRGKSCVLNLTDDRLTELLTTSSLAAALVDVSHVIGDSADSLRAPPSGYIALPQQSSLSSSSSPPQTTFVRVVGSAVIELSAFAASLAIPSDVPDRSGAGSHASEKARGYRSGNFTFYSPEGTVAGTMNITMKLSAIGPARTSPSIYSALEDYFRETASEVTSSSSSSSSSSYPPSIPSQGPLPLRLPSLLPPGSYVPTATTVARVARTGASDNSGGYQDTVKESGTAGLTESSGARQSAPKSPTRSSSSSSSSSIRSTSPMRRNSSLSPTSAPSLRNSSPSRRPNSSAAPTSSSSSTASSSSSSSLLNYKSDEARLLLPIDYPIQRKHVPTPHLPPNATAQEHHDSQFISFPHRSRPRPLLTTSPIHELRLLRERIRTHGRLGYPPPSSLAVNEGKLVETVAKYSSPEKAQFIASSCKRCLSELAESCAAVEKVSQRAAPVPVAVYAHTSIAMTPRVRDDVDVAAWPDEISQKASAREGVLSSSSSTAKLLSRSPSRSPSRPVTPSGTCSRHQIPATISSTSRPHTLRAPALHPLLATDRTSSGAASASTSASAQGSQQSQQQQLLCTICHAPLSAPAIQLGAGVCGFGRGCANKTGPSVGDGLVGADSRSTTPVAGGRGVQGKGDRRQAQQQNKAREPWNEYFLSKYVFTASVVKKKKKLIAMYSGLHNICTTCTYAMSSSLLCDNDNVVTFCLSPTSHLTTDCTPL